MLFSVNVLFLSLSIWICVSVVCTFSMYSSNMVRINKNLLVHSLVGGNFGYFQLLTTTNNVAINIFAHVTWFTCAHISKEYKTRSRNARLHGVYIVNLFRSLLPNFFLNWLYHFSILLAVYMNVFYCNTHLMTLLRFL